jgi:sporulation protein YlmC with PRC-barrel domain
MKFAMAGTALAILVTSLAVHSAEPPKGKATAGMPVIRANQIAGMKVVNASGEDLGKIEDVVVDIGTGHVRYAAISFGGFLGVGDKLFAIPFKALKLRHNAGDKTHHFELNVTKETLERAQGFDKKNWPDFADPRYGEEYDRPFLDRERA